MQYRFKKPVNLGFLDFSELSKRRYYCQEEIRLNRRLAPQLYLEVIGIGGSPAQPVLGEEPIFEYAVKMLRFPDAKLLDHLLSKDKLTPQHFDQLAKTLANFHTHLEPAPINSVYGTLETIASAIRQNFEQLATLLQPANAEKLENLKALSELEFTNSLNLFEQRRQEGFIRECHGDLI